MGKTELHDFSTLFRRCCLGFPSVCSGNRLLGQALETSEFRLIFSDNLR